MNFHFEPTQYILRGYSSGSYIEKSPYDVVMSLFIANGEQLFVYATHGKMSAAIRETLIMFAKEHTLKEIIYVHKGRKIVVKI